MILCGPVCHCVNLSDRYRVYWKWCFSVCEWVRPWGKFAKFVYVIGTVSVRTMCKEEKTEDKVKTKDV